MGSLNQVSLIGNLGMDPEQRATAKGTAVANFRIATNESYTDKDGNTQERVEWHRIVAWGRMAGLATEYLKKGQQIFIQGRLQTREYTDREGVKRYNTEVVADKFVFLNNGKKVVSKQEEFAGEEAPFSEADPL